ncbi:MAG TPA: AraC family transcriptional regulator ligand-binding domain-containing protein, partial [Nevskiaceae bacterium]|nr:AraC family transcriptional regulator ligand-binding domain-containing protein [Nevskiaceae bacterium]
MRDSGQLLAVVHAGMVKAGLDVDAIYTRLGYDAERLDLRALRTRHQAQVLFWHTVETVTGDADIGLHLCPHLPVFRGDVLEYLVFSSPTFGEGCRRALKYLRLVSDAIAMRLVQDAQGSRLAVVGSKLDAPQLRHTEICVVYELIRFAQSVTEGEFRAHKVKLRFEPRSLAAEYKKVFGCPVEFGGSESEIWFDPKVLAYRSPHWDPDLLQLHEELAEKRLSTLRRADLIDQIRRIFSQRLELETLELEDVARELGMPPRRLRFELTRAGTSFSDLLAGFRYALARRLL